MSLSSFIAKVGVNPEWIAFNAHAWFAYSIVHTFGVKSLFFVVPAALLKEFWFDATYENPKQTFVDNALDFLGYMSGAVLAAFAIL